VKSFTFLTAQWRNLALLNYEIDPRVLHPLVPRGTELDTFGGRTFVSLVGFLFARTRVLGVPVPAHRTFEEVNLRFYVKRSVAGEVRRGVAFIKELVPRPLIASVARLAYNEPYESVPMRHLFDRTDVGGIPQLVSYEWYAGSGWAGIQLERTGPGRVSALGSEEEFITEHYWGYTRQRDGSTVEYAVFHPRWTVWSAASARAWGDLTSVYGDSFAHALEQRPTSAFLAAGSVVTVGFPSRIPLGA
jgi:uncharacterized protein YqjF (DUF2071 family)